MSHTQILNLNHLSAMEHYRKKVSTAEKNLQGIVSESRANTIQELSFAEKSSKDFKLASCETISLMMQNVTHFSKETLQTADCN